MESTKEKLEKLIGLELNVTFDTRKETGCEDEQHGHFIECEVAPNPIPKYGPPVIVFYENELVQFFHEATPYPVKVHTTHEAREMSMFLNPAPVNIDKITGDDFTNFINSLIDEYEEE